MTPARQLAADKAEVRRINNWGERYGLDEQDKRELAALLRRIAWLERQTAPTVRMRADWQMGATS